MAVFPGLQGGPHNHTTAGIAVALAEAATSEYREYGKQIVTNARVLADSLTAHGISLVGGGTENHLMLMDFSNEGVGKGTLVGLALNAAGIVANRNTVPGDKSPFYPSGVRIGTPAVTTRGMKEKEMELIAQLISDVVARVRDERMPAAKEERPSFVKEYRKKISTDHGLNEIRLKVKELCNRFPSKII